MDGCCILQDRKKLALYKEMDSSPVLDLNASQSTSLLKKLTDKYVIVIMGALLL